jgi:phosphatidylinositol dimannoside acyltransferase|uniref:phosphatidylinositol mannoside acyltransferase n=1 Tax=Candidatus Planktophila sp. TaxID=2175601 RepID=UPI00404A8B5F
MNFDFLVAAAYFSGWKLVRTLPEKSAYSLFEKIGEITLRRNGSRMQRLRGNLQRVCPEKDSAAMDELMAEAVSSYMRYWCDTFRSPDWSKERIFSSVTVTREELLTGPMRDGRGVVVTLPHSGNWDHAGSYFCAMGFPLVTVAEKLKPEALFNKFLEYRQNMGMEVLSTDSKSMGTLMQRAREGALIALVADRDLSRSGVDVNFFGYPARMPAGGALLAIRTAIPLVTAHVSYTKSGIHIEFNSVAIPSDGTESERVSVVVQRCADQFATGIAKKPADWHMLQRIWVDGDFQERS